MCFLLSRDHHRIDDTHPSIQALDRPFPLFLDLDGPAVCPADPGFSSNLRQSTRIHLVAVLTCGDACEWIPLDDGILTGSTLIGSAWW